MDINLLHTHIVGTHTQNANPHNSFKCRVKTWVRVSPVVVMVRVGLQEMNVSLCNDLLK